MALKLAAFIAVTAVILYVVYQANQPHPAPKLSLDFNWGPSSRKPNPNAPITPQQIQYPKQVIDQLRRRLNETTFLQEPLEGIGFEYGFNAHKLTEIIDYWRDDYLPRWSERQQFLNSYPHFSTEVQGLKIHFIHVKPKTNKKTTPLLLLHGWPGSVREFYDIIPKLTDPNADHVFEVVVPSLVGYGWSEGAAKPGMGAIDMATIFQNLMVNKLGHKKYLIQGGDWGSLIGASIAALYPENVIGYHSNMCAAGMDGINFLKGYIASFYPSFFIPEGYEDFHYPMGSKFVFMLEESGYFHLQATKPDTIGHALSNNPVGLAAYILEKFSTWTNVEYRSLKDGGLEKKYTKDALLDNIMIYYLTNSITTSARLYAESFTFKHMAYKIELVPVTVPTGCARFKHDLMHNSDWQLKSRYPNLVTSTYHRDGGHFAAFEAPNVLYSDFIAFAKKLKL